MKRFEVVSPFNGANVGAFGSRQWAKAYTDQLNAQEADSIAAYHVKEAAFLRSMKMESAARMHETGGAMSGGYWVHLTESPQPIDESQMEEAIGPYCDADPGL
jgi:hypothetical protein